MKNMAEFLYKGINKILPAIYFMYLFSMLISMAGMEIFGWTGIFLTIYLALYKYIVHKENIFVHHPLNRWFLILAVTLAITVITAPYTSESGASKIYYLGRIRNLIFFSYHLLIFERIFSYKKALKTLLYFMLPIVTYALLQKFGGFDPIKGIWSFNFDMANTASVRQVFNIYLTYINVFQFHFFIMLSFAIMGVMKTKLRFFLIALSILFLISFIFSNSRAIVPAIFVGMLVQFIVSRKLAYIAIIGITILTSALAYNLNPYFKQKADSTLASIEQLGDKHRYGTFQTHLQMFRDHPIKGVGYEMNEPLTPIYNQNLGVSSFVGHSHNIVIQMLSGTGLLGTIPFLILWSILFYMIFKAYYRASNSQDNYNKALCNGLVGAFVSFWINGMTQWNFGDFEVTHNMMFFMAVGGYVWLKQKQDILYTKQDLNSKKP
jgi:O-antigen ligase